MKLTREREIELELEFTSDPDISIKDFAERKGLPYRPLNALAIKHSWMLKRKSNFEKMNDKLKPMTMEARALALHTFDLDCYQISEELLLKARELFGDVDTPAKLKMLADAVKSIQSVARLAMGANTESMTVSTEPYDVWLRKVNNELTGTA